MVAEPGEGKQRHVGNGVLVAGSDKRQQTPPDSEEFCRAFGTDCHPDCQTNQPVTQCAFKEQNHCRRGRFRQSNRMDDAGIDRQQATATPAVKQSDKHGTDQVTQPGFWQDCPHLTVADGACFDAERQKHGVTGKQFRTGNNDQR